MSLLTYNIDIKRFWKGKYYVIKAVLLLRPHILAQNSEKQIFLQKKSLWDIWRNVCALWAWNLGTVRALQEGNGIHVHLQQYTCTMTCTLTCTSTSFIFKRSVIYLHRFMDKLMTEHMCSLSCTKNVWEILAHEIVLLCSCYILFLYKRIVNNLWNTYGKQPWKCPKLFSKSFSSGSILRWVCFQTTLQDS